MYLFISFWVLVSFAKLIQQPTILYPTIFLGMITMAIASDSLRIGFALMLVPNIRMFDGLGTTMFVNILMFVPVVAKIISDRRINKTAFVHTMLLASLELIHILVQQQYDFLISNMVTIFTLMYVETVLLDPNTHTDFPRITRVFAFGSIYSAVMYFIKYAPYRDMSIYFKGLGYRYEGYASDPNYFALYMCLAVAMLFIIPKHKKRDIVYIFALAFIELFTLSKMALVLLLVTLFYFAGKAVIHGFRGKLRFVKYVLLTGIGVGVIFSNRIVNLIELTFSRLQEHNGTEVNLDSITSGRASLTYFYLSVMSSDPIMLFFGHGLQYYTIYQRNLSHNTLLDVLFSWGLVGAGLMVVIFYTLLHKLRKNCPEKIITPDYYFPLFILLLTFFALSCLNAAMFWWVVCAALLPLKGIDYEQITADLRDRARV